jgi:cell division protein FtsB
VSQGAASGASGDQSEKLTALQARNAEHERELAALRTKNDELLEKIEKLESDVLFQQKR